MAPIKVHGMTLSPATQRVVATLYEKELEFELVPVDLRAGENTKEPFLALNPFGQIPAFEDGDSKLFESRAITKYIADQYDDKGTKLTCSDAQREAMIGLAIEAGLHPTQGTHLAWGDTKQIRVWIEVEAHQFDPPASKLYRELVAKPVVEIKIDKTVVEENKAELATVLDVYEKRLGQSKYLACDNFTLADLHHLPTIQYLLGTEVKKLFDSRPYVSAWVANITARPAWRKVLASQKH